MLNAVSMTRSVVEIFGGPWTFVNTLSTLNFMLNGLSVSDALGRRIAQVRKARGLKASDLANRCADLGVKLSVATISDIETRRRNRSITVDELFAIAYALDVAPVHLLVPVEAPEGGINPATQEGFTPVTPEITAPIPNVRAWIRGYHAMQGQDARLYFAERPLNEWQPPTVPDAEQIERHGEHAELVRRVLPAGRRAAERDQPES